MKKGLFIGAVVGAAVSWFLTRRYYMEEIEALIEELEIIEREGNKLIKDLKKPYTPKPTGELLDGKKSGRYGWVENEVSKIERKGPRVNVVENVKDLAPNKPKVGVVEERRTDVHVITEDEYDEHYENYDKIEIQYHVDTNTLYDENGDAVDVDDLLTSNIIDNFYNDTSAQFVYVRNHKLEIDYLVEKEPYIDYDSYENLTGIYQEEKQKILDEKNRGVKNE